MKINMQFYKNTIIIILNYKSDGKIKYKDVRDG